MDVIPFIKEILFKPVLTVFLSYPDPDQVYHMQFMCFSTFTNDNFLYLQREYDLDEMGHKEIIDNYQGADLYRVCIPLLLQKAKLGDHTKDEKLKTIMSLQLCFSRYGISRREVFKGRKVSQWSNQRKVIWVKRALDSFVDELVSCNYLEHREVAGELEHKVDVDAVINPLHDIKSMEDLLLANANSSNCFKNDEKSRALLLITTVPVLRELKDPNEMLQLLLELSTELNNLPELICKACEEQPQSLLLIGGLLSVKPRTYDTWNMVKDDLVKIKESNNGASDNHMGHIYTYCYDDLPYSLIPCFLYLACYPINYKIPARPLTEIWIAEGFVEKQDGETIEETANKYLEQLVQRSLVWVSKRSNSGAIKCCQIRQSIHEFCIKKSCKEGFLVANPNKQEMKSTNRVAFYNDDKKQYTEGGLEKLGDIYASSVVCFDFDMNVLTRNNTRNNIHKRHVKQRIFQLPSCFVVIVQLEVLELRKSIIPQTFLPSLSSKVSILKYLGLRGSNISELPENIEKMKRLKTLDVRETNIKTLPESLWNIITLRHVYVNHIPQIKGPPSTANINDLQILKTVAVHESWLENFLQFLSNLRKLALSNRNNPNSKSNPYWKSISKLLSHMSNLLSMTIIGDIVPSEFVDIRAFPNLETVKSIKLEGEWFCRKLFIDHVKFPPNIVKLTLIKSGLKEDPISMLGRLQTLKYLSLQDGAYTGKKMVCSANGFPQLRFLELSKLDNLEIWEVKPMAMSQLTTLRVFQCLKLKNLHNLPNLGHVKVIEN